MTSRIQARLLLLSALIATAVAAFAWTMAPSALEAAVARAIGEGLIEQGHVVLLKLERSAPGPLDPRELPAFLGTEAAFIQARIEPPGTLPLGEPEPEIVSDEQTGARMVAVSLPLPASRGAGMLRLERPLPALEGEAGRLRWLIAAGALAALLAALGLSSLASHWTRRRIGALAAIARRMAAGDEAIRARSPSLGSIGELSKALDELADSLFSALRELRTERDQLTSVLETLQEGVLVLDGQGRIEGANPALREMLLLPPEILGRPPLEVVRSSELQQLIERAREEPASAELELASGLKPCRVAARAAPLTGAARGTLVTLVDVTNVRRLESMRRELVANVSHELRTPIASIRSAAETLSGPALRDPPAASRFVAIIERNSQRMQQLVDDLLDLARLDAKELKLQLEPIEAAEAIEQAIVLLHEKAERRRVSIEAIAEKPLAVQADRRALDQALANLIDNAVKYCPEGSRVVVRAAKASGRVRLAVEDSGPGIEARHLPRLFERFFRVDPGRSRELGGTGLGLSIVKHLVEAMGGTVGVESAPGHGSTFWLQLPPGKG
jgi:two-component system phosphate regulon sensor histidine kinase PhoR